MNPSIQEDPDRFNLHVGTNELCLCKSPELMQNLDMSYRKSWPVIRKACHKVNNSKMSLLYYLTLSLFAIQFQKIKIIFWY